MKLFNKNKNEENYDIDYNDYYDNEEKTSESEIPVKKELIKKNKEIKVNNISKNEEHSNSIIMKVILILIVIICIGYSLFAFFKDKYTDYEVKINLTSFGLIKTKINNVGHQINYLTIPETNRHLKIDITPSNLLFINTATNYITPLNLGEATIKFKNSNNKKIKNEITVYIVDKKNALTDFTFNKINSLSVNSKDMITITPIPKDATDVQFSYTSSNPDVAIVNNNGIIKGLKKGSSTITIYNNNISKSFNITIK